jgi:hypothetical protein
MRAGKAGEKRGTVKTAHAKPHGGSKPDRAAAPSRARKPSAAVNETATVRSKAAVAVAGANGGQVPQRTEPNAGLPGNAQQRGTPPPLPAPIASFNF